MSTTMATRPAEPLDDAGNPVGWMCLETGQSGTMNTPLMWHELCDLYKSDGTYTSPLEFSSNLLALATGQAGFLKLKSGAILVASGVATEPEEPSLDTSAFSSSVQEAFDAEGEGQGPEFDDPTFVGHRGGRRLAPPSDTVLKLDHWSINKGKRLANDELHKDMVKAGLTDATELADAHAACFDLYLDMAERPKDKARAKWYEELLNNPDFAALRAQTNFDLALSDIACQTVTKQWIEYKKMVQQGQDEDMARMRSAACAAKQAKDNVQDAAGMAGAFGLERGNRTMQDPTKMLALFKKIKKNPSLKRICELAGAYRRLAQARQRVKDVHAEDEVVDVTLGGEVDRLLGSEISRLAVPELEDNMLRRLMEKQAMVRQMSGVKHIAKGPIMVLLDESGSMSGEPNEQAKAMSLALAWVAKSQGRWCALVSWSSGGQYNYITLPPGGWDGTKVSDWCCGFIGGGTNPPIDKIAEIYAETGASNEKCDMVWISDGCASVDPAEAEAFNAWRHERKARSIALLVQSDDAAFRLLCDEIHIVKSIDATEGAVGEILGI